ncbi:MAG: universal stress protein [Myxococcales bacterium]
MRSAPPVQLILAAIDGSKAGHIVFRTAAQLAQELRAQLFLMHVLNLPPEIPPGAHTRPDHAEEAEEDVSRASLQALMAEAPGVGFGPPIVVEGEPWRVILDVASDLNVDLIVLGCHRSHGLERILGTVAAKVVNHADRNVLVVRNKTEPGGT